MAKDGKILITLDLVQKGDKISLVQKETEKLAKSTDKVGKSRETAEKSGKKFHKREKGIMQSNLSSAKGFSKMKETMTGGGSSSLVAAYATLAANIFAATAAFNALRTAAQVTQLIEGFTFLAAESGRTATLIAGSLRDITDGALSMEEALRASALAISAGFRTDQLEELATVAKNASIALGRNLGDSVDRLVRGVAKLEPEILDELGIMVRLDDAVEEYAASLGKAGSDLTQFERRQAFLNATISQGAIKYGALGDAVEQNPWEQLAATLDDLKNTLLGGVSTWLQPFIKFLASSQFMLLGLIVAVSAGIINQMFPVLTNLSKKSAANAVVMKKSLDEQITKQDSLVKSQQKAVSVFDKGGASIKKYANKVAKGTARMRDHKKAVMNLKKSEDMRYKWLFRNTKESFIQKAKNILQIRRERNAVIELMNTEQKRNLARAGARVKRTQAAAAGMEQIGAAGPVEGFKKAREGLRKYNTELKIGEARAGNFNKVGGKRVWKSFGPAARTAFLTAGQGVKFFGAALVNAIPFIGQIIFFVSMAIEFLGRFMGPSKAVKEAASDLATVSGTLGEKTDQLTQKMIKLRAELEHQEKANTDAWVAGARYVGMLKIQAGMTDELTTAMTKLISAVADDGGSTASNWWNRFKQSLKDDWEQIVGWFTAVGDAYEWLKKKVQGDEYIKDTSKDWEFLGNKINSAMAEITKGSAEAASKFENELPAAFAKVAKTAPVGPIKDLLIEASKAKTATAALALVMDKAGEAGIEVADMEVFLNRALSATNVTISAQAGNVTGLSDTLGELSKSLNTFANKMKKKNEFRTISDQVKAAADAFTAAKNQTKADGEDWATVVASLSTEMSQVLADFGITEEQVASAGGFDAITKQFDDLADMADRYATESKMQKYFIQETKALAKLNEQMLVYEAKLDNLRRKGKFEIGAGNELQTAIEVSEIRLGMIVKEEKSKLLLIQLEYDLLEAKIAINLKMAKIDRDRLLALTGAGRSAAITAIESNTKASINSVHATLDAAFAGAGGKGSMADRMKEIFTVDWDAGTRSDMKQSLENKKADLEERAKTMRGRMGGLTKGRALQAQADEIDTSREGVTAALIGDDIATNVGIFSEEGQHSFTEKVMAMRRAMTPLFDQLKELGPEGVLAAAVGEGGLIIASTFETITDKTADMSDRLMAVATIFQAIGNIAAASSKKKIAAIDAEIKAEKKRDGTSKASLAKIKALEKKKETIARKAFEMNKKMMIATAIASTAAAVVGVLGKEASVMGFFASIPALIIGAMGLAQVAIIRRQKFEGGGGEGGGPSVPQSISVGKRSNKINVANQSSAGELAYLRGDQGVGTSAQRFSPTGGAAGMIRNYAVGGIIVGEQGPEMITPRGGIEVTPNGALGGGTTNANFTINAVDAMGVEEVLTNQRGNIISMIRAAAHDHGEEFIEAVDTNAYGDAASSNTWTGKGGG